MSNSNKNVTKKDNDVVKSVTKGRKIDPSTTIIPLTHLFHTTNQTMINSQNSTQQTLYSKKKLHRL